MFNTIVVLTLVSQWFLNLLLKQALTASSTVKAWVDSNFKNHLGCLSFKPWLLNSGLSWQFEHQVSGSWISCQNMPWPQN